MRRLERRVGNQHDLRIVAELEILYPVALLVEQVRRHLDGQLRDDLGRTFLAGFLADETKDGERQRFDAANRAKAGAARAGLVGRFANRRPQALARHLEQTETTDLPDLHARAVLPNSLAQPVFDVALMLRRPHIDEIDHYEPAQIANTQLTCDLFGRLEVGIERRGFDIAALGRARRVDIDRHQCLGVVDDDAAA